MFRSLVAFIVAPFPIALIQAIVVGLWPKIGGGVFEHPVSMFVAINLYFYIFGLALGLPAWLIARKRSASLSTFALFGAFIGLIPVGFALVVLIFRGQAAAYVIIYDLVLFGLGGMAAGALFWRMAIRHKLATSSAATFA